MSPNKSTEELALLLQKGVNWKAYFNLVHAIDNQLDSRKLRFFKSDVLELGIDLFGPPELRWVDEQGWDHELDHENGEKIKIEMKTQANFFWLREGIGDLRDAVTKIQLSNTRGGGQSRSLARRFDYLLLADRRGAFLVSWDVVSRLNTATDDQIVLRTNSLKMSNVSFIACADDYKIEDMPNYAIKDTIYSLFRSCIKDVKKRTK